MTWAAGPRLKGTELNQKIYPSKLTGTIAIPASKSEAHRLLICAAFADAPTSVECNATSQDIEATVSCLQALGACVKKTDAGFEVAPVTTPAQSALLDCGESGSTLRFMLPVVAALGCDASLTGHGRLPERPLSPLYEELCAHGADLGPQGQMPLHVGGKICGRNYKIAGNVSSQYVTGLLLAAPLMGGLELFVTEPIESMPYIDITIEVMRLFGVEVGRRKVADGAEKGLLLTVAAGAAYKTPGKVTVGGDWSNSAFWLAAGALSEEGLSVSGLDFHSAQGDKAILGALALLGARVSRFPDHVCVSRDNLHGCVLDVSSCPDLVPPLAAVACMAKGTTKIVGAARLKIKESDRLQTVSAAINALGGNVTITNDGLVIDGVDALCGGTADAANDHRIAMMSAVLATYAAGPSTVMGAECVAKSYPAFFEDLAQLGGSCEREN